MALQKSDSIGYVTSYIGKNFGEVVGTVTSHSQEKIRFKGLKVDLFSEGTGGPLSTFLTGHAKYVLNDNGFRGEIETVPFFVKHYQKKDRKLPRGFLDFANQQCEFDAESYNFCSDFPYMPYLYSAMPDGRVLILEFINGRLLEQHLESRAKKSGRVELVKDVLEEVVSRFHMDVRNKMVALFGENTDEYNKLREHISKKEYREGQALKRNGEKQKITQRITTLRKAHGYLRAIKGLDSTSELREIDENLFKRLPESYWPISLLYDRTEPEDQLSHGNLTATNIIVRDDVKEKYCIIDPKIKFRQPIIDVAELISSQGMELHPSDWDLLVESYWKSCAKRVLSDDLEAVIKQPIKTLEIILQLIYGIVGKPEVKLEAAKKSLGVFYRSVIHESLKNMAKVRDTERYFPEIYDEWMETRPCFRTTVHQMQTNIKNALDALISKPEQYDVSLGRAKEKEEQELQALIELRKILFDEGWIEPEDLKYKLKEKHYRKIFQNNPPNPGTSGSDIEAKSGRFSEPRIV